MNNQLHDAIFPVVLYPAAPGAAAQLTGGTKPFIELALVLHQSQGDQKVDIVKYFKVLVQEIAIKLDKGFLLSLLDFFSTTFASNEESDSSRMLKDLSQIRGGVDFYNSKSAKRKIVYEFIHISPLKFRLSFSLRGNVHRAKQDDSLTLRQDILDFLINSIGAILTDIRDLELKAAFFEISGLTASPQDLLKSVKSHYVMQLLRQTYVLILGLDVLGNPFGLIKDFTQGLGDLFYEPIMGSIYGPEKFADGVSRGMQSLLG